MEHYAGFAFRTRAAVARSASTLAEPLPAAMVAWEDIQLTLSGSLDRGEQIRLQLGRPSNQVIGSAKRSILIPILVK
jgi:hypothetical protein